MVDVSNLGIDPTIDPTLEAADRVIADLVKPKPSGALDFSDLGEKCFRRVFYKLRDAEPEADDVASVKRFVDAATSRQIIVSRLKTVCNVQDKDDGAGRFEFTDYANHLTGKINGIVKGLVQAPVTWHVLSVKTSVKWKGLKRSVLKHGQKDALQEWDSRQYAHAIMSMFYSGLKRHYTIVSDSGGRNWISVRTDANPKFAKFLRNKAEAVIFTDQAPERIGDVNHFMCRVGYCPFALTCQHGQLPNRNCKTCLHSTPERSGGWSCALGHDLAVCGDHRFLPSLIDGDQVDVRDGDVVYLMKNGTEFKDNGKA